MLLRLLRQLAFVLLVPALSGVLAGLVLAPILDCIGLPPDSSRRVGVAIGVMIFIVITRRDDDPNGRVAGERKR